MICKWFTVNGIKVQGLGEKFVADELTKNKIEWIRSTFVKLPNGKRYTPDIDVGHFYIEIKGMRTCLKALGILSLLENGSKEWSGNINKSDLDKIVYVHKNVKPILLYINDNDNDHKYQEYWVNIKKEFSSHDINVIYGKSEFQRIFSNSELVSELMGIDNMIYLKSYQYEILELFKDKSLLKLPEDKFIQFDWDGVNGAYILKKLDISKETFLKRIKELEMFNKIRIEITKAKERGAKNVHGSLNLYTMWII